MCLCVDILTPWGRRQRAFSSVTWRLSICTRVSSLRFYQIRAGLKVSPRVPHRLIVTTQDNAGKQRWSLHAHSNASTHTQFDVICHNTEGTAPYKPLLRVAAFYFPPVSWNILSWCSFCTQIHGPDDYFFFFFKSRSYNTLKPRLRY